MPAYLLINGGRLSLLPLLNLASYRFRINQALRAPPSNKRLLARPTLPTMQPTKVPRTPLHPARRVPPAILAKMAPSAPALLEAALRAAVAGNTTHAAPATTLHCARMARAAGREGIAAGAGAEDGAGLGGMVDWEGAAFTAGVLGVVASRGGVFGGGAPAAKARGVEGVGYGLVTGYVRERGRLVEHVGDVAAAEAAAAKAMVEGREGRTGDEEYHVVAGGYMVDERGGAVHEEGT